MAVHLIGLNPLNKKGELFVLRDTLWYPIWEYCQIIDPEIREIVKNARTETLLKINETLSSSLSENLKKQFKTGKVYQYEKQYNEKMEKLQREKGIEATFIYNNAYEQVVKVMLAVAKKKNHPILSALQVFPYTFSTTILLGFIEFLENCGGFQIT